MRELQNSVESRLINDHGATMLESRPGVFLPMLYGMQKKLSFSSKTTSPLYSQRAYFLFLTRGGCFESQRATTLMFSTDMSVQNLMSLESLKIEIAEKETVRVCQSACVRAKVCICVWVGVCEGERERERNKSERLKILRFVVALGDEKKFFWWRAHISVTQS